MRKLTIIVLDEEGKEISRHTGDIIVASVGERKDNSKDVISSCSIVHGIYNDLTRSYLALGSHIHDKYITSLDEQEQATIKKPKKKL